MSILPTLEPTVNGALLTLDDGHRVHLRTLLQCEQLVKLLRDAHGIIDEQNRDRGSRLDRDAARRVNELRADINREWPGGTLAPPFTGTATPATTERRVLRIDSNPCASGDVA